MSLPPSPLKRRHHHERVMSALLQPKSIFTDVPNIFSQDLDENDDAWTAPQNRDTEKIDEMELKIAAGSLIIFGFMNLPSSQKLQLILKLKEEDLIHSVKSSIFSPK